MRRHSLSNLCDSLRPTQRSPDQKTDRQNDRSHSISLALAKLHQDRQTTDSRHRISEHGSQVDGPQIRDRPAG